MTKKDAITIKKSTLKWIAGLAVTTLTAILSTGGAIARYTISESDKRTAQLSRIDKHLFVICEAVSDLRAEKKRPRFECGGVMQSESANQTSAAVVE